MKFTTCDWSHLTEGLKKVDLLRGILSDRDKVTSIKFTTPSGEEIVVPEGSKLEVHCDLISDMFAIGIEHKPGEYGMTHGPTPDLGSLLAITPPSINARIICFPQGGGSEKVTHVVSDGVAEWQANAYDPDEMCYMDEYPLR